MANPIPSELVDEILGIFEDPAVEGLSLAARQLRPETPQDVIDELRELLGVAISKALDPLRSWGDRHPEGVNTRDRIDAVYARLTKLLSDD
jgi:hypothetical protein